MEELLIEKSENCVHVQYRDVLRDRNEFVQVVYSHWHYGGFWGYTITRALQVLSVGLVLGLLFVLAIFVDWPVLMIVTELTDAVHASAPNLSITIFLSMALLAWVGWVIKEVVCVYTMWRVHCVLLHIFTDVDLELDMMSWEDIVDQVSQFLGMQPQEFTTRMLRQKQFMTALARSDHLTVNCGSLRINMLSYPLVWALYVSFLPLLDDAPHVHDNSSVFSKRAVLLGILGLVLSPCVFVIVVVYYICRYGEHLRHQPGWMSSRHWSLYANLYLRKSEDTNHALRERLDAVEPVANKYCQTRYSTITFRCIEPLRDAMLQFAMFCFSMGTVLILALALFDDDVLVRQTLFGRALLWWLGILAGGIGVCRMLQRDTPEVHNPAMVLQEMASDLGIQAEFLRVNFSSLYEYRLLGFLWEMASVVLAPLFLLFVVRGRASNMLSFLHYNCVYVQGIGCVKKWVHQ